MLASRTGSVADEYAAVSAQIDALYKTADVPGALPAEIETAAMTRLRQEAHARMLGNGLCTRPVQLECRMESACESCAYFETEVVPSVVDFEVAVPRLSPASW